MLVNAAAGLFAHPATVLRFIDRHSYSDFAETLKAVLDPISKRGPQSTSAYAELDALYMLILQRVPSDILPSMQLFLQMVLDDGIDDNITIWFLAILCNMLGISESHFRGIYHHVQAVMDFQEYPSPTLDETINPEQSFFDQDLPSTSKFSAKRTLVSVHGAITFRHKSFYDFLRDPARSSSFCVTTPAMRQNLFNRLIQQYHHYTSSYVIQGSRLLLRTSMAGSSASLSWPQGSEFVDSYLKPVAFLGISFFLSHDYPHFRPFLEGLPSSSLQKLAEFDYRKYLLGLIMLNDIGTSPCSHIIGLRQAGVSRTNEGSEFIQLKNYADFDPDMFLTMVDKLDSARVIRPYHPRFGSSRATSILHTVSRRRSSGRKSGLYKFGHGDKSMIWYWEFDTEKRYFHEFKTVNYEEAMAFYKAEKFTIWDVDEDGRSVEDEGDSNVEADELEHRSRYGHEATEEQAQAQVDNEDGQGGTKIPPETDRVTS